MQMELQGAWGTAVLCSVWAPGYRRFLPSSGTLHLAPTEAGPQACARMIVILALSALHKISLPHHACFDNRGKRISLTHLSALTGGKASRVCASGSCGGAKCQCCSCGLQRGGGHHHLPHPVLQPLSPDP